MMGLRRDTIGPMLTKDWEESGVVNYGHHTLEPGGQIDQQRKCLY
jgi:hypothetical protein